MGPADRAAVNTARRGGRTLAHLRKADRRYKNTAEWSLISEKEA